MLYSGVASRLQPPQLQDNLAQEAATPAALSSRVMTTKEPILEQKKITLDIGGAILVPAEILQNDDMVLSVTPIGTGIKDVTVRSYDIVMSQTDIGLLAEWQADKFEKYSITDGISMSYVDDSRGFEIKKSYKFTSDKYIVEMFLEFISFSDTSRYVQYSMNVGSMSQETIKKNPIDQRYLECSVSLPSKTVRSNFLRFNPKSIEEPIQWVGLRDRYFCVIMRPLQEAGRLVKNKDDVATSYLLQVPQFELSPGERVRHSYLLYIGPQKQEFIEKLGANAENIINFGFFDSLSHILLGVLRALYRISNNWGVALILFSLLVFLVMSPLSMKSFKSMKRMQEVQPIIEELKAKYKDNPQKMNKEVMELYKEKKINPLGGCLPMFLQMPIFIALYQTLMRFIDLKGASFLWIKDLSEPDRLVVFSKSLPIIGNELNLLPLVMVATMLLQQKLTSSKQPQASGSAHQQKMMSLFMAVFFGIIFYKMPAGLVMYWSVNSITMLVFQAKVIGRPSTKPE